ncbi:MAG: molybdopterin-dependent oxidoreductase [Nitrospinota bacterium]
MKVNRRTFMQLMGLGAVAVGNPLSGCTSPEMPPPTDWPNREETWISTVCRKCPGGCGLRVRRVDGRPVKLEGNPFHPINAGTLCPKGHAQLQQLYSPDRIRQPLKRVGKGGSAGWKPIAWDEALQTVVSALRRLREAGRPERLLILGGQYRGVRDEIWTRFATAYGTPNYVRARCLVPERAPLAHQLMTGITSPIAYDLPRAGTVLSFGCNLLESWLSSVYQIRAYGHMRQERPHDRGIWIQVDPRLSVTASKADQWIPIRPGTDGALALGISHALVREGLYNRKFVERYTFGFDDWEDEEGPHSGFRTYVLRQFSLPRVSRITGVPIETIIGLARTIAGRGPTLVLGERGPLFHRNDLYTRMAIHALNGLLGSLGVPGTLLENDPVPLTPWEDPELDEVARQGRRRGRVDGAGEGIHFLADDASQNLPEHLLAKRPYPIEVCVLYRTNPLFSQPASANWAKALRSIPLVVSFSPFLDETAAGADLILPDHLDLEAWQDDVVTHLGAFSAYSVGRPAIPPLHQTRDAVEVILAMARGIGGAVAKGFDWDSVADLIRNRARGLYAAGRGSVVGDPVRGAFEQVLERQGIRTEPFKNFDGFWEALLERGAWWDAPQSRLYGPPRFQTPSKKFEFFSQTLRNRWRAAERGHRRLQPGSRRNLARALAETMGLQGRGDDLFLPHLEEGSLPASSPERELLLVTYKLMSQGRGGTANQPWSLEYLATHLPERWDSWIEINPQTARNLGILDRSEVVVESSTGRLRTRARLYGGVPPNVVAMPFGLGHERLGRWARGRGANPNRILEEVPDLARGFGLWSATPVLIRRA